jgi:hypothetical protein
MIGSYAPVAAVSTSLEVGMKLAARLTTRNCRATGAVAALLLASCTTVASTPSQIAAEQVAQAGYLVGTEREPRDTTDPNFRYASVPDDSAPRMWIATMTPTSAVQPGAPRFLARIRSDGDYPPMGISRGLNYVWREDTTGIAQVNWRYRVTPARKGAPDHPLTRVPRYEWPLGSAHAPNLLRVRVNSRAFVICLDDCPPGHCGYR